MVSKPFGDLWELRLDVPGGHFDAVNLEEEIRTAKAGPYQRCFACGNAGPWKKCGGSECSFIVLPLLKLMVFLCRFMSWSRVFLWFRVS